jgi:hypothetical protein
MTAPAMESALLDWASDNGLKHEVMIKVSLTDDLQSYKTMGNRQTLFSGDFL